MFMPNVAADSKERSAPNTLEGLSIELAGLAAIDEAIDSLAGIAAYQASTTATGVISTIISGLANPVTVTRVLAGKSTG